MKKEANFLAINFIFFQLKTRKFYEHLLKVHKSVHSKVYLIRLHFCGFLRSEQRANKQTVSGDIHIRSFWKIKKGQGSTKKRCGDNEKTRRGGEKNRLMLCKKVVKRCDRTHISANKNDRSIVRASQKTSMLGLPKFCVAGRNFDRQHHLIK